MTMSDTLAMPDNRPYAAGAGLQPPAVAGQAPICARRRRRDTMRFFR